MLKHHHVATTLLLLALTSCSTEFEPEPSQVPFFPAGVQHPLGNGNFGYEIFSDNLCDTIARATCGGSTGYEAACFPYFSDWQDCHAEVLAECCDAGGCDVRGSKVYVNGVDPALDEYRRCLAAADEMNCLDREDALVPEACLEFGPGLWR